MATPLTRDPGRGRHDCSATPLLCVLGRLPLARPALRSDRMDPMPPTIRQFTAALALAALPALAGAAASIPPAPACIDPSYHALDFWAGDWDVFDAVTPAKLLANVRVSVILEGCALREEYRDPSGLRGLSVSSYVASRDLWQQTWLTNRGQLLVLEGGLRGDEFVLEGTDIAPDGKPRRVRGIWKRVPAGVRETAVRSTDGGETWVQWFDLLFRAARPATRRGA
jgi:hypothetical protein